MGVNVEVEKTVDASCVCDGGVTMTEEVSSVKEGWVVREEAVVNTVDGSSLMEEVVSVVLEACRLNSAMASSRGSAATNGAKRLAPRQKRTDCRMLNRGVVIRWGKV